ncbi:MAG: ANTAR domain-containing protein [Clostridia bacterium]|nr:ANTAR domain-containing protein [Clostridia bacterium]
MSLREHVYSVLLVSSSEKMNVSLTSLLPDRIYYPLTVVSSVSEAQRKINEQSYDFVIVNAPLPDDFGRKFAIDVTTDNDAVTVLIVKNELYDETYDKVAEYGVLTISKPTNAVMMKQTLDYMRATRERLYRMQKKTVSLEDKMTEIRLVNKAKWVLIENRGYSEEQAHKYIEKTAMDLGLTRREVAQTILQSARS